MQTGRPPARRLAASAGRFIIVFAALLGAAAFLEPALAEVSGTPPRLYRQFRVRGSAKTIGNTLMSFGLDPRVNEHMVAPLYTAAELRDVPIGATIEGAYVFYSGRQDQLADNTFDFYVPDGRRLSLSADTCRSLSNAGEVFFYCRRDVTSEVRSVGTATGEYNGTYNVNGVRARPGSTGSLSNGCAISDPSCQAAYAGWSMVVVWSHPQAPKVRNLNLYDGFYALDETFNSGISAPVVLSGFEVGDPAVAELSFFALEGDPHLGSPPLGSDWADFMRFIAQDGTQEKLNDPSNPADNLFNSTVREAAVGFNGVDIDTFRIGVGGLNLLKPGQTSARIQPGSGDGQVWDNTENGELFILGYVLLAIDTIAPEFGGATDKVVDKTSAAAGETLTYTITVENTGSEAATHVVVKDDLPAGTRYVHGSTTLDGAPVADAGGQSALLAGLDIGTLDHRVGTTTRRTVTWQVRIDPSVADGTVVCNTATVDSDQTGVLPLTTDPCTTVQAPRLRAPPTLAVTDLNGGRPVPGDRLRYRATLTNDGSQPAREIAYRQDLPPWVKDLSVIVVPNGSTDASSATGGANGTGFIEVTGIRVPGQFSVDLIFEVTVLTDAEFAAAGVIDIDGLALSTQGTVDAPWLATTLPTDDPATPASPDPTVVVLDYPVDLSTSTKTGADRNGGILERGDLLDYVVTVRNSGVRTATVQVVDELPAAVEACTVVSAPPGTTCSAAGGANGTGRLTAGGFTVAGGASVQLSFNVRVAADAADGTVVQNRARITLDEASQVVDVSAPALRVVARPILSGVTKGVVDTDGGDVEPGDELVYTLTLRNEGNIDATRVAVADPLDPNLTAVTAGQGGLVSGGAVQWTEATTPALSRLAPGAEVTLTLTGRVVSPLANGTVISNQATVRSAEVATPVPTDDPATSAADDPTRVTVRSLPSFVRTTKTVTDLNGGDVRPGDRLRYSIVVRNDGTSVARDVVVTDDLDPALVNVTPGAGGTVSGGSVTWTLPTLDLSPAGDTTLTFEADVASPLANGTVLPNQAFVKSREVTTPVPSDDPATSTTDDPTSVTIRSQAVLADTTKTVVDLNGGAQMPGDVLEYRLVLRNTGDGIARDVTVEDPIAPCLTSVQPMNGGLFAGGRVTWSAAGTPSLAQVVPGADAELVFRATIAPGTPNGTTCANQAFASSLDLPAPVPTDDPGTPALDDPTVVLVQSRPVLDQSTKTVALTADRNGDGEYSPGDQLTYTLTIENTGSEPAVAVTVRDPLPPQLTNVSAPGGAIAGDEIRWTVPSLAVGAAVDLTFTADVVLPLDDGTVVANQAFVDCPGCGGEVGTDDPATADPDDPTTVVLRAAPVLTGTTKDVADPDGDPVRPDDALVYTVTVRNTGTSLARNVAVTDRLDPNLTFVSAGGGGVFDPASRTISWDLGTLGLSPADDRTFTVRARVVTPLDNGTVISNQALVAADELPAPVGSDDPRTAQEGDPTLVTVVSGADLTGVTKEVVDDDGAPVRPGDALTWSVTLTNTGDAIARDVTVEDLLDASLTDVVPGQGGVLSGDTVRWTPAGTPALAAVAPGDVVVLTLASRVLRPLDDGTPIANQALVSARDLAAPVPTDDPSTPDLDDPTEVLVESAPDLSATAKTVQDVNGGDVRPGDELVWTVELTNGGDMVARDLTVSDVLDDNLEFVSASGGGVFDPAGRTVTWAVSALDLAPAGDTQLTVRTRVPFPLDDGTVLANQATVAGPTLAGPVLTDDPATPADDDPTQVTVTSEIDLSATSKTVTDLNGGEVEPGDRLEYEIRVENAGDMIAYGAQVTDPVDPILVDVTPADGGAFDPATRTVSWPAQDVAPGPAPAFRFTARVAPLTAGGTVIANQAQVAAAGSSTPSDDPDTAADDDPTQVTVVASPVLAESTKTVADVDGGLVRPGDTLRYTLTVRNTGNTYATDVSVEDPIDPALTDVTPGQGGIVVGDRIRWDASTTPALAQVTPEDGGEIVLSFTARIRPDTPDATTVLNQALVRAAELAEPSPTDDPATPEAGDPTGITVSVPDLSAATKTVTDLNDGEVEPEDVLRWTIEVPNRGSHPATNVTVVDALPDDLIEPVVEGGGVLTGRTVTWSIPVIEPGESATVSFTAKVRPLLDNLTRIENQGFVSAAELPEPVPTDDPRTVEDDDSTAVLVVSAPDMAATTKAVEDLSGDDVVPGDRLRYVITVRNRGNTYARDVVVRDSVPAHLTDVETQPPARIEGGELVWRAAQVPALAEVAPGDEVELTLEATVESPLQDGTEIVNQGLVSVQGLSRQWGTDDPSTPAASDATVVRVFSAPRLSRSEKTGVDVNGGALEPGDLVEYTILIVNDGTETADGVVLTDSVPAWTRYVAGSTRLNGEAVPDADGGASPLVAGLPVRSTRPGTPEGTVLVDDGEAPDDEVAVVTFQVRVEADAAGGTAISNQGLLVSSRTERVGTDDPATSSPGDPTVLVVGRSIHLADAYKGWRLVEDAETPGVVEPGDVVAYDLVIPNRGSVAARGVILRDPLPEGVEYVAGSLTVDEAPVTDAADGDPGRLEGDAVVVETDLDRAEERRVSFRVRILEGAPASVVNQAEVSAVDPNGGQVSELTDADPTTPGDQPTVFPVGPTPVRDLSTSVKSVEDVNGGRVRSGDLLRYTISLRNTGNVPVENAGIADDVPEATSWVETVAPEGARVEFQAPIAGEAPRGRVTVRLGEPLPVGATARIEILVRVDADLPDGKVIENLAKVAADDVELFDLPPVRVIVGGAPGTGGYAGRIYEDTGEPDTRFDPGEDWPLGGFTVTAHVADDPDGAAVRTAVSDGHGDFVLLGLQPGEYRLRVVSATGVQFAEIPAPAVGADAVTAQDGLIDPSGVIYRAGTDQGLAGAEAWLLYDDSMVGRAPLPCDDDQSEISRVTDRPELGATPDNPLPRPVGPACLPPGQQGQTTPGGDAAGFYRFDVPPSDPSVAYRLQVVPPAPQLAFPSVSVPAAQGFAPAGPVVENDRPALDQPAQYWLRFDIGDAEDEVTNNHVPLDAMQDLVRITKVAGQGTATIGELVPYTVTVTNASGEDILSVGGGLAGGLTVRDLLPAGMRFVEGSARADRLVPVSNGGYVRACPRIDQDGVCPSRDQGPTRSLSGKRGPAVGGLLAFGPYDLPAGEQLEIHYTLLVAGDVEPGEHTNRAVALLDSVQMGEATATVRVLEDPLFDQGTVFGKVYCDRNGDGLQDPGDRGLPGARIYADTGNYAVTDASGKYHLHRLPAGMRLFKIDDRTLPPGSELGILAAQPLYMTPGLDTSLDYPVKCVLDEVAPDTVSVRTLKPPPVVRLEGGLDDLSLTANGEAVGPLTAEVWPAAPDATVDFVPPWAPEDFAPGTVPAFHTRVKGEIERWRLVVAELPLEGGGGDPTAWPEVASAEGAGAPPRVVSLPFEKSPFEQGKVYAAWLLVEGQGPVAARSPVRTFGVGVTRSPPAVKLTLEGENFPRRGTKPTEVLKNGLAEALSALERDPETTVEVDVHVDASYGARAQPLSEQRAAAVEDLLVSQGVAPERIRAVGKGSTEPVVPNIGRRNQARNRRVEVRVIPPAPDMARVPRAAFPSKVTVSGVDEVPVSAESTFELGVEPPGEAPLVVSLRRVDGATLGAALVFDADANRIPVPEPLRPVFEAEALKAAGGPAAVAVAEAAAPEAPPVPPAVEASAAPAEHTAKLTVPEGSALPLVTVDGVEAPLPLLALEVLVDDDGKPIRLNRRRRPVRPLSFGVQVPEGADIARWTLEIADAGGRTVGKVEGSGAPPENIRWDGTEGGKPALQRAEAYRYRLSAEDAAGNRGTSADRSFAVAARTITKVVRGLFSGTRIPPMRRVKLGAVAAQAKQLGGGTRILVDVHTDNKGGAAAAKKRTAAQAREVKEALVKLGVPARAVSVRGRGATRPLVPNLTPKNREKNRRVVLRIVPPATLPLEPAEVQPKVSFADVEAVSADDGRSWSATVPAAALEGALPVEATLADGRSAAYRLPLPEARPSARAAGPALARSHGGTPADLGVASTAAVQPTAGSPLAAASTGAEAPSPGAGGGFRLAQGTRLGDDEPTPVPPVAKPAPERGAESDAAAAATPAVPAPKPERKPEYHMVERPAAEVDPAEVPVARTRVWLAAEGKTIRAPSVGVLGTTAPGSTVLVNGESVDVSLEGRFGTVVQLPRGASTVKIQVTDEKGNVVHFERAVESNPDGLFILAMADTHGGATGAELWGVTDRTQIRLGPVYLHGRGVGYAKGEWTGAFGPFEALRLTAHLDTAKDLESTYFQELIEPQRHYAIYGDSGQEVSDVNSAGPLYLAFDADKNRLLVGNYKTVLGTGGLFDYQRTYYGAKMKVDETVAGRARTQADLFIADGDIGARHGHVELLGTGGSLYFLKDRDLAEGSERLRVVVRDRDTGIELMNRPLVRNVDYVIRYREGQVLLKAPLNSVASAGWMTGQNLASTLDGHPTFLVADYEYLAAPGEGRLAGGGYLKETVDGWITFGGGALGQGNGPGTQAYSLWGLMAELRPKPKTYLKAEFARSDGTDAAGFYSADGGLNYFGLVPQCTGTLEPSATCRTGGNAFKLEAGTALGELMGRDEDLVRVTGYAQLQDYGFYNSSLLLDHGQRKAGLLTAWDATENDAITARFDWVESDVPETLSDTGLGELKRVTRTFAGLRWAHRAEKWRSAAEWSLGHTDDAVNGAFTTNLLAVGGEYDVTERLTLLLEQDLALGGDERIFRSFGSRLMTTAGARFALTEALRITGAAQLRWNGENSALVGIEGKTGDSGTLYARERLTLMPGGGMLTTTVLGGEQQLTESTRTYGEYQLDGGMSALYGRAVIGLANLWKPWDGVQLGLSYERVQVLGDVGASPAAVPGTVVDPLTGRRTTTGQVDGLPPFAAAGANPAGSYYPGAVSRDAGSVSAELLRKSIKASLRFELRWDDADDDLVNDPALPGVADRLQAVVLGNAAWQWTRDLAVLGRVNWATTENRSRRLTEALWLEATAGVAFRPVTYDWVNVLFKYTRLVDQRPLDLQAGTGDRHVSDVLAVAPVFETPWRLGVAEKLAYKHSRIVPDLQLNDGIEPDEILAHTVLWVNRLDFHLTDRIDLSGEYRLLWTAAETTDADTSLSGGVRSGLVLEAAWRANEYLRVGAGWNFAGFSDDELSRFDRDEHGPFLRVIGMF